jgi:TPR repeat protein
MMTQTITFQKYHHFFSENTLPLFDKSDEYKGACEQLKEILLLADRIVCALDKHPDYGRAAEIVETLPQLSDDDDAQPQPTLDKIELWLKGIWWLKNPEELAEERKRCERPGKTNRFNLFAAIVGLNLLTQQELDSENTDSISDPVRKALFKAYEGRNKLHDAKPLTSKEKLSFLEPAFTMLVAPIFKHFDCLKNELKRLITYKLNEDKENVVSPGFENFIKSIGSERKNHLDFFKGRLEWVKSINEKLESLSHEGGYLLLVAPEGTGKSALSSEISRTLCVSEKSPHGSESTSVICLAPWLPGALLHMGKQSSDSREIAKSLIAQANCMLLTKVQLPMSENPFDRINESSTQYDYLENEENLSKKPFNHSVNTRTNKQNLIKPTNLNYERFFLQALESLILERGHAIFIVDALEEIGATDLELGFLPRILPPGVSGFLTVRPNTQSEKWIKENLKNVTTLSLGNLEVADIPIITGVANNDEKSVRFNDKVFTVTKGLALLVRHIATDIKNNNGQFDKVSIDESIDSFCRRQYEMWMANDHTINNQSLGKQLLLLFGVFEPVATPLSKSMIQNYLSTLGINITGLDIEEAIKPVATQLVGIGGNRLRLSVGTFGSWIRKFLFTPLDIINAIYAIGNWLATDEVTSPEVAVSFVKHWGNNEIANEIALGPKSKEIGTKLLKKFNSNNRSDLLLKISTVFFVEKNNISLARDALKMSADSGFDRAMLVLGNRLLDGRGFTRNVEEGEIWLRKAADSGLDPAMLDLGTRLLDGIGVTRNVEDGEIWLRKAADSGFDPAMFVLGNRLLDGKGLTRNVEDGEIWLRKAADSGFDRAMFFLGNRLLDGRGLTRNVEEGKIWLRKAADSGFDPAMFVLGNRLLEGDGFTRNAEEGEIWLRKAADSGLDPAMLDLGTRLLDGNNLTKNPAEGETWLRKAADSGFDRAMLVLGNRLLDGRGFTRNVEDGEIWLRKAADSGFDRAMLVLGNRLLDGRGFTRNVEDGEIWLRKAADAGLDDAMLVLGNRLLDGRGFTRNVEEGETWLRKAADSGFDRAMFFLGNRLLDGIGLTRNVEEGEIWLRKAADAGLDDAMLDLGNRLLDGIGLTRNVEEGEIWLRKAADSGFDDAMLDLGNRLLDGIGLTRNVEEGEIWLRKAADAGLDDAMLDLGTRLLDGRGFTRNVEEGEIWLRKAADAGLDDAMLDLGTRLLDGRGFTRNVEEGEIWLRKAADSGLDPAMLVLGNYFYKLNKFDESAKFYFSAFKQGENGDAGINLAYILRRKEVPDANFPKLESLLAKGLLNKSVLAILNLALAKAAGFQTIPDWISADNMIKTLADNNEISEAVNWFKNISTEKNDPEGHLVIAWFTRHKIIPFDPDGLSLEERMRRARQGPWAEAPEWLNNFFC